MRNKKLSVLSKDHPHYVDLKQIETALLKQAGGIEKLKAELPILFKNALNEVLDGYRTNRITIEELEKTEKTYIGTKVEILIRNYFRFQKGTLDLKINGRDVDIKNTIGRNWMIPPEAIGKTCILVALDNEYCWLGVIIASTKNLTKGANRDGKRSVSAAGLKNVHWILSKEPYPVIKEGSKCPVCGR
jgi:hypothetical protein